MSSPTISQVFKQTKRNRPTYKADGKRVTAGIQQIARSSTSRTDEEILRDFDLTVEYGPCIGITRLERWQRAHKHGMNPPQEVKDIIMDNPDSITITQCVWENSNI